VEFPHSDISGSKVAWHLPEAYRRHAASFIAFQSLGIHHTPLFVSFSREKEFENRNNLLFVFFELPVAPLSLTFRFARGVLHFHSHKKTHTKWMRNGILLSKNSGTYDRF
jgi:hypothetical protein